MTSQNEAIDLLSSSEEENDNNGDDDDNGIATEKHQAGSDQNISMIDLMDCSMDDEDDTSVSAMRSVKGQSCGMYPINGNNEEGMLEILSDDDDDDENDDDASKPITSCSAVEALNHVKRDRKAESTLVENNSCAIANQNDHRNSDDGDCSSDDDDLLHGPSIFKISNMDQKLNTKCTIGASALSSSLMPTSQGNDASISIPTLSNTEDKKHEREIEKLRRHHEKEVQRIKAVQKREMKKTLKEKEKEEKRREAAKRKEMEKIRRANEKEDLRRKKAQQKEDIKAEKGGFANKEICCVMDKTLFKTEMGSELRVHLESLEYTVKDAANVIPNSIRFTRRNYKLGGAAICGSNVEHFDLVFVFFPEPRRFLNMLIDDQSTYSRQSLTVEYPKLDKWINDVKDKLASERRCLHFAKTERESKRCRICLVLHGVQAELRRLWNRQTPERRKSGPSMIATEEELLDALTYLLIEQSVEYSLCTDAQDYTDFMHRVSRVITSFVSISDA